MAESDSAKYILPFNCDCAFTDKLTTNDIIEKNKQRKGIHKDRCLFADSCFTPLQLIVK